MLTDCELRGELGREGYAVLRSLLPRDEAIAFECELVKRLRPARSWSALCFDRRHPDRNSRRLHAWLWDARVITLAEALLGPGVRTVFGMLAMAPPYAARGFPWHQDNQYVEVAGAAVTIYIAVSAIEQERGQLWVGPDSHFRGVLPHRLDPPDGEVDRSSAVAPERSLLLPNFDPGDACVFDRNLLHRSLPNTTDRLRLAYSAQFVAAGAELRGSEAPAPPIPSRELARLMGAST